MLIPRRFAAVFTPHHTLRYFASRPCSTTHDNKIINMTAEEPKITLYANRGCPYAHRAHVALKELGLKHEEVIIDLSKPREPWYLEINPRGLVPAISYNNEIITESAVIVQFLADAHPSHLAPATGTVSGALRRARMAFFADTWSTKVWASWITIALKDDEKEEQDKLVKDMIANVEKEIEPLLKDANPFFGGSDKVSLAEVLVAPSVQRLYVFARHGFLPQSLADGLDTLPNFKKWAATVINLDSVTSYAWDESETISLLRGMLEKMKPAAKSK